MVLLLLMLKGFFFLKKKKTFEPEIQSEPSLMILTDTSVEIPWHDLKVVPGN